MVSSKEFSNLSEQIKVHKTSLTQTPVCDSLKLLAENHAYQNLSFVVGKTNIKF
jgi:hypothetical protein